MSKKIGKLANRYAKALLHALGTELGEEGSRTRAQQIAEQIGILAELWKQNRELRSAILSPAFREQDRRRALETIAREIGLPEVAVRFLLVIFDRERTGFLPEISEAFTAVADQAANVVSVTVETAKEVPIEERLEIEDSLRRYIHGRPQFQWRIDGKILGGIVVRFNGHVLDGSLSGRLERLERSLLA